jgi:hypothetical protein
MREPERESARSLTDTDRAVLAIIKRQRKGKGIQGKAIVTELKKKGLDSMKQHCGGTSCRSSSGTASRTCAPLADTSSQPPRLIHPKPLDA